MNDWGPYISVAERRTMAERLVAKLRRKGQAISPVRIEGRSIATTFWGKAWCDNIESYQDYESRLPRGRTYVRNGSVIDLQIAPREVKALVSGSTIYKVAIRIKALPQAQWRSLCRECTGGVDSLVALLQGRFSKAVMERMCRQEHGLFPKPSEIDFSCSCLDGAWMCKHIAAALYGVGSRLDTQPELLFRLRDVDEKDLVVDLKPDMPLLEAGSERLLDVEDLSALFGFDLAESGPPPPPSPSPQTTTTRRRRRKHGAVWDPTDIYEP